MAETASIGDLFHPAVAQWLANSFKQPTPPQRDAWPLICAGDDVLVSAPTGSGKTLCGFLASIDRLVREAQAGTLPEETRVLYLSPLKALSNDIERNLRAPLAGVREELAKLGLTDAHITTAVRTGDTSAKDRTSQTKKPAHIYVTTPESLYILLTSDGGRRMLSTVQTVIVDEVHAMVKDKRGSHLALSLERLDDLLAENGRKRAQRIGLSATQKPIERVAEFLMGMGDAGDCRPRPCHIVNHGHQRPLDLSLMVQSSPLEGVMSAECWSEVYDQLAELVLSHHTTLIFTNTRRLSERITRFLAERIGDEAVTSHHGSLSRQRRQAAELALKEGKLKALVATASLELGIDVGDVDLVCQIGSPGSIATFLQRVGRSGHFVGGIPKGRIIPLSRDDLVESIALLSAAKNGELDEVHAPTAPLDILAQQLVAWVAPGERYEKDLLASVRRAAPYKDLTEESFDQVVNMLAEGFSTSRGRRSAHLHRDQIGGRLKARRGARLSAITNGGAIPDNFDYDVLLEPSEIRIGSVHEDFAIESLAGDIFQLGNASYQILKVSPGAVRVADARGKPPTIPFWIGESPSRSDELSWAVSELRTQVAALREEELGEYQTELCLRLKVPERAVEQMLTYLRATLGALGHMPTQSKIVAERFFDETGGMHVVIHSPFGSRFNRGFGLALRKRFCRSFNVELQAAAGEDALVLSLGPMHSFPLDSLFQFLKSKSVREVLVQALLDAPLFQTRWRWNASRALAILRFRSGKKVPPRFQRMQSDDLLALCFPDQVACLENIAGDREVPSHPLVQQTIVDSLTEAMDIDRLEHVLAQIEAGAIECVARDVTEPSPLAHEILSARPYAFLDDAPLEERRTQAVQMRRFSGPKHADDLGKLDPLAISQVLAEAAPDPRDADELHDSLLIFGCLPIEEAPWPELVHELRRAGRVYSAIIGEKELLFATERTHLARGAYGDAALLPANPLSHLKAAPSLQRNEAVTELVRGRMELVGPTTSSALSLALSLPAFDVDAALLALEQEGFVLRGFFKQPEEEEFCERRLLARIHRLTLGRLRREIEPVSPAVYLDFLTHHQCLAEETRKEGVLGTQAMLAQLSGYVCAAESWETSILPSRVRLYQKGHLDQLCLSGQVTWSVARRGAPSGKSGQGLMKSTPIRLLPREDAALWLKNEESHRLLVDGLKADARRIAELLLQRGALFFSDIRRETGLLESQAEAAVAELMGGGLATTDSYAGVRALLVPTKKRPPQRRRASPQRGFGRTGLDSAGRISWLFPSTKSEGEPLPWKADDDDLETIAWQLLGRWGVVFRKVLEREVGLPSWGELLRCYHRLEARGEIRGGRFVTQFSGEQFATPEAIALLRRVRNRGPSNSRIKISATDPLNLVGILTPGEKVAATRKSQILLQSGVPTAKSEGGVVTLLGPLSEIEKEPGPALSQGDAERAFRERDEARDLMRRSAE